MRNECPAEFGRLLAHILSVDPSPLPQLRCELALQAPELAVEDPNARRFIHGLRQGDKVEVTYLEALAVEIRPAG
jgi:hypothetical protein